MVVFIRNYVISHLNKNKKSLGTLKAFGLDNSKIIILYSLISSLIIVISFIMSFVLASLLGPFIFEVVLDILNIDSFAYRSYNIYLMIIIMFCLPIIWIVVEIFRYLSGKTPGDLIYERK